MHSKPSWVRGWELSSEACCLDYRIAAGTLRRRPWEDSGGTGMGLSPEGQASLPSAFQKRVWVGMYVWICEGEGLIRRL